MKIVLTSIIITVLVSNIASCNSNHSQTNERRPNFEQPSIEFNPRSYICYKLNDRLQIDGELNEQAWLDAKWTDNFIDIEGIIEPIHQTRVKMLWDKEYLYIAAELIEPHINGQLIQRDTVIFYDNDFEVFIDPDGDTHNYFEFEMNALNTVWDLFITRPYREQGNLVIDAWNILGLKSAVKTYGTINNASDNDEKWTVELAFPMNILTEGGRGIPKDKDVWRINFSRVQWQYDIVDGRYKKKIDKNTGKALKEYNWVWSPQGVINMHYPEMWGFLQFSTLNVKQNNEQFEMHQSEILKWELRKVYYAQKNYFAINHRYATSVEDLQDYAYSASKKLPKISIQTTQSNYEATIKQSNQSWSINSSGRTFKTL